MLISIYSQTFALLSRSTKINFVTTYKKNFAIFVVNILDLDVVAKDNLIFKENDDFLTDNLDNSCSSTNNFDFEDSLNALSSFFLFFLS